MRYNITHDNNHLQFRNMEIDSWGLWIWIVIAIIFNQMIVSMMRYTITAWMRLSLLNDKVIELDYTYRESIIIFVIFSAIWEIIWVSNISMYMMQGDIILFGICAILVANTTMSCHFVSIRQNIANIA
jgi:hypothetical protein